jgi:hypothetical protein
LTSNPEEPRRPEERGTLPLHSMQYYEQYRSHDRWDRVLRFFQRLGEALGAKGTR